MALSIYAKNKNYLYLFEAEFYEKFDGENCNLRKEILILHEKKSKYL